MSRSPPADDCAEPIAVQERQQVQWEQHDEYDDEDAEQPTDQQILEEISLLYHQPLPCVYGAASALNGVLQGPYFDDESLATLTGGIEIDAYAMNMALQSFALALQPVRSRRSNIPLRSEKAFLCFHEQQWYAIRRFGVHWMHLRDTLERPFNVQQLELCLSQQQADGCEIYVVCGQLPQCSADERSFWQVPFSWNSLAQHDATSHLPAHDRVCVDEACATLSHCMCNNDDHGGGGGVNQEAFDRRFEEDMRAAIAASLQDLTSSSSSPSSSAAMRIKRDVSSSALPSDPTHARRSGA